MILMIYHWKVSKFNDIKKYRILTNFNSFNLKLVHGLEGGGVGGVGGGEGKKSLNILMLFNKKKWMRWNW